MTKFFQLDARNSLFLAVVLIAFATQAPGQEGTRTLTGSVTSGYSSLTSQGDSSQGPYVGFDADLVGFWKDSRILQYEIAPSYASGFQWAGTMYGPQQNGIVSNATFLDGSRFPLTVYFSRVSVPSPEMSFVSGGDASLPTRFVSLAHIRQNWGLDWTWRGGRKYPTYHVHYSNDTNDDEFPAELGGTLQTRIKNLWMDTTYRLAGWQLDGRFTNINNNSQTPFFFNGVGRPLSQATGDREWYANAAHKLPLSSMFIFTAEKHHSDFDLVDGQSTSNDYSRYSGSFAARPWSRLSINIGEAYITSFGDFVRSQLLSGTTPVTLDAANALTVHTETAALSNNDSVTFTIAKGLVANGFFSKTTGLDSTISSQSPDTRGFGGGLTYTHRLFGGDAGASYQYNDTRSELNDFTAATPTLVSSESVAHSVSVSYAHSLPWQLKMQASGNYSLDSSQNAIFERGRTFGASFDVSRTLSGWYLSARSSYSREVLESSTNLRSTNAIFGLKAKTKTLQLDVVDSYTSGLAYIFGNTVVVAPTNVLDPTLSGLPFSNFTSGNMFYASASYQPTGRLYVHGMWSHGNRWMTNFSPTNYGGYNFGLDYRFRHVKLGAGYSRTAQHVDSLTSPDFLNRQIYFQIKRDFRLF